MGVGRGGGGGGGSFWELGGRLTSLHVAQDLEL